MNWKAPLQQQAQSLIDTLETHNIDYEHFCDHVAIRLVERTDKLLAAIQKYRRQPSVILRKQTPVAAHKGNIRLLDYTGSRNNKSVPVCVVPSLVNRAYILDICESNSFMAGLRAAGFAPYLVDWGTPDDSELGYSTGDYLDIVQYFIACITAKHPGHRSVVVGYCMGGTFTLALAHRLQDKLGPLAVMATPWDFHGDGGDMANRLAVVKPFLQPVIETYGFLPAEMLQWLFAMLDPLMAENKFARLDSMEADDPDFLRFVMLEDWLNDSVALAGPVARDSLIGWYESNSPAAGRWAPLGTAVKLGEIKNHALVVVPTKDRIVPPSFSACIARQMPHASQIDVPFGHIGMVFGKDAPNDVFAPIFQWLKQHTYS